MTERRDVTTVVGALARYLRTNPRACDTAEGIHRWWFAADAGFPPDAVARALDWMTGQQLLETTTAADGHQRFRLRANDEALAALLRSLAGGQTIS